MSEIKNSALSSKVLSQVLIMQNMLFQLPSEGSMISFVIAGLRDIPGILNISYSQSRSQKIKDKVFTICRNNNYYGEFYIDVKDEKLFSPYIPYLENLFQMFAVIREEQEQRKINIQLMNDLEKKVNERTLKLKESRDNIRITLNSIGDAVLSTDIDGKVVEINPVAEKLTGWKACDAVGLKLSEVFSIHSQETGLAIENPVSRVLKTGKIITLENGTILKSRNGKEFLIADSAAPILDEKNIIRGVVLVFRDLTDEYKMKKHLKNVEDRYMRVINSLGKDYCIFSHTVEGVFTYLSDGCENLFGVSAREMIGRNWRELNLSEKSIESGEKTDENIINNRSTQKVELECFHKNGTRKIIEVIYYPVIHKREILYLEGVCKDITEQVETAKTLQNSQKLESLGVLAGGIAHDFNNLLSGIFSCIDLVKIKTSDQDILDILEKVSVNFDYARSLTNQLITFSKGGDPVMQVQPIDSLLTEAVIFALSGSKVRSSFSFAENLKLCNFDKNQIKQVINNLSINAVQAMPDGGCFLVSAENIFLYENENLNLSDGEYVKITFQDTGKGIPEKNLQEIFDPFYSTKENGHGLGLSTSFSIIKRHHGVINASSKYGEGATFSIYLPAAEKIDNLESASSENEFHQGQGLFLVLDDNPVIKDATSSILTSFGYQVISFYDGDSLLKYLSNNTTDNLKGIITDLTVPDSKGGAEIISDIRGKHPSLPVIVISGYHSDPVMSEPLKYGFTDSLSKPYKMKELSRILDKYII